MLEPPLSDAISIVTLVDNAPLPDDVRLNERDVLSCSQVPVDEPVSAVPELTVTRTQ